MGRNSEAVFRDKSGKRRDLKNEKQKSDAKDAEWKDKYDKWAKGYLYRDNSCRCDVHVADVL